MVLHMKGPFLKRQAVAFATASLQAPFELSQSGRTGVRLPCIRSPWPKCASHASWSTEDREANTPELFLIRFPEGLSPAKPGPCVCVGMLGMLEPGVGGSRLS